MVENTLSACIVYINSNIMSDCFAINNEDHEQILSEGTVSRHCVLPQGERVWQRASHERMNIQNKRRARKTKAGHTPLETALRASSGRTGL